MTFFDRVTSLVKPVPGVLAPVQGEPVSEPEEEELQLTLVEHLDELRRRLIIIVLGLAIGTAVAFALTPTLFQWLLMPAPAVIHQKGLVFTEPTEAFLTYFQVSLYAGIGLSMPLTVFQILAYVVPALTRRERRLLYLFAPLVGVFFLIGVAFGFYVTLPFALRYLLDFTIGDVLTPFITVGSYIGFVTTILFWMGLAFETPIIILFLSKIGLVNTRRLSAYRKYAILIAFVIAAVITPTPDPVNQALVAIPLWILYELGIVLARFT
ncbi:MAG: twin-arginine translocase subunit TatC [Chloroflexota bacterium]|nr:MAG: twin-arginine translocase subunit TatC [Chloroflexota bacterium]